MPRLLAPMPDIPLMQISMFLVRRRLAAAAVRRAAMVIDVRVFLDDGREDAFVDVTCGEVGLAEIRLLVGIVELELTGFGELVV